MAVVTRHAPGTICWVELGTSDAKAAVAFYSGLFNWRPVDSPMPDGGVYTMLFLGEQPVGALYQQDPEKMPAGVPPSWLGYIAVADADATLAKVKASAGTVVAGPYDAQEYGRMGVCTDTLGATFAIWQPGTHAGIGRTRENGAFAWAQLNAADPGSAALFYQSVFGWAHRRDAMPQGGDYLTWMAGDQPAGGGMPMPPGTNAPAHWLLYFGATDVDTTAAKAAKLGGQVLVPPTDIPGTGRFAVLADPQGAVFAIVDFVS